MKIRDMQGLGAKSEAVLASVGINTPEQLRECGAFEAFIKIRNEADAKPSLNFLYAMTGALENRSWLDIAQNERESMLMAIEGLAELEKELASECIKFKI